MMRLACLALLMALGATGCKTRSVAAPGTVWAPAIDAAGAARMGADAAAGGEVAAARLLRRHGLPPSGGDSTARGWVAGRYPLRSSELVVVAVPLGSGAAALGAWLEVARLTSRLSPWRLFPETTVLFAAFDGDAAGGIDALRRDALWVADSVRAVVLVSPPDAAAAAAARRWGTRLVPVVPSGEAGRGAAVLFEALRRESWGLGAPTDSLRAVFRETTRQPIP